MTTGTLPLTCVTPNKRPKATEAMRLQAAVALVKIMVKDGLLEGTDLSEAAQDIAKAARWTEHDGYRLARELERTHHWDCDMQIAEALEEYSTKLRHIVDAAVKVWAAENPMVPLPDETEVMWRGKVGTITGVYAHAPHSYELRNDESKGTSRWIVPFEDVTIP